MVPPTGSAYRRCMAGRLPRISMEPAPGYVPFVESHLAALRQDARRLTGDGSIAEEVSSGALTDVALRWYWLELLRVRLRRPDPAGTFLGVALSRRCARRSYGPDDLHEVGVESAGRPEVRVRPAESGWPATGWYPEPDVVLLIDQLPAGRAGDQPRTATSAAVRIADVNAAAPLSPSPVMEAVIAWLHAYKTYVRYRRIAAAALAVLVFVVLLQLRSYGAAF
jgi:hypothetical protein